MLVVIKLDVVLLVVAPGIAKLDGPPTVANGIGRKTVCSDGSASLHF